ncbi:MAG: hypothetical protein ACK4K0_04305 [Flavobacteriales bacterium]
MIVTEYIWKNKVSIITTLMIHIVLIVVLHETYISYPIYQNQLQEIASYDFREEVQQDEEMLIDPMNMEEYESVKLMNVTANSNLEKTTYTSSTDGGGVNKAKVEEQVWKELRDLEAKEYQRAKVERGEIGAGDGGKGQNTLQSSTFGDNKSTKTDKEIDKNLIKEGVKENENAGYGKEIAATATLELKGRHALALGKPAYKCKVEGVVVVTIRVNRKGEVTSADIDESRTNTQNDCLRNEALKYARDKIKTRINQNFEAETTQTGAIIYRYVAHR